MSKIKDIEQAFAMPSKHIFPSECIPPNNPQEYYEKYLDSRI